MRNKDIVFIILNSNQVKTYILYQVTIPYGETVAGALVDYHIVNGGVSRYQNLYQTQNI